MSMVKLPTGWSVTAGGRTWTGEIPEHLCPDSLKPAPSPAPPAAKREKQKEQEQIVESP